MTYTSLEQRMAQTFIDMFPQFVPDESAPVNVSDQEHFYSIINTLYHLAFNEPLLFVTSLHEDDAYPTRYKKSYGKPKLIDNMRKYLKAIHILLKNMYLAGKGSDVKFNKKQLDILLKLGINDLTKLPAAWNWMSARPESNLITFSHCLFKKDYPYVSDIYASLLGEPSLRKLEKWMIGQGYKRYDIYDINSMEKYNSILSDHELSLTYANPLWSNEAPKNGFEYKIRHTGISVQYDFYVQHPVILGLCIPNGLKTYLDAFDSMSLKNQGFVVKHAKKCDGCRYCVQTDKTGSRPLAFINVKYAQKEFNLCPYFPGYGFSWRNINDELVDQLIDMLSFMDTFINPNGEQCDGN